MRQSGRRAGALLAIAVVLAASGHAWAAHAAIGTPVADTELALLEGGRAALLGDATTVLVFFRVEQERSARGLRELAACRRGLSGRPARWVGIVSDAAPAQAVRALVQGSGFDAPVLVDHGDAIYGRLGVAQHPVVVIVGADRRLAAFEPFRSVGFCAVVTARLRHALGEIGEADLRAVLEPPESNEGGDHQVAARYRALARMQLNAGHLDKGLASVQRSLDKDPGSAEAHALMGEILARQGRCAEAARAFDSALTIDPSNAAVAAARARCANAR